MFWKNEAKLTEFICKKFYQKEKLFDSSVYFSPYIYSSDLCLFFPLPFLPSFFLPSFLPLPSFSFMPSSFPFYSFPFSFKEKKIILPWCKHFFRFQWVQQSKHFSRVSPNVWLSKCNALYQWWVLWSRWTPCPRWENMIEIISRIELYVIGKKIWWK